MRVDDEMLMAYLDGELDVRMRAEVEIAIAADPTLQARLDSQRRLGARLDAHYGPVADEAVPPRLRALLEPEIVDLATARAGRSRPLWQTMTALAATLVLGIALGTRLPGPGGPVSVDGGRMLAQGSLATALDTQLASAQTADAETRIGISFARTDGKWCRTFDSAALAGVACRDGEDWQVMMTAPGTPRGGSDYRQASSGNALVAQAAQELMAGEALDAAGERAARDASWRR